LNPSNRKRGKLLNKTKQNKTKQSNNKTITITITITMPSDSSYSSVTRYTRRPFTSKSKSSAGAVPVALHIVDEAWVADTLSDDEVEIARHEAAVAPLLEEGELDADAIVVSPTGNSASAANNGKLYSYKLYI
jgi:hypothetical protein